MRIPVPFGDKGKMQSLSEVMESHGTGGSRQAPLYQPSYIPRQVDWPVVKLRLEAKDLSHPGAKQFFQHINPTEVLRDAVVKVLRLLYTMETCPRHIRSVTLHLDDMAGVAYTKGSELDNDHKEIHFSMSHIVNNKQRAKEEITGVVVHEMVHCFQYNGKGSCPGSLIEGIADYVRLRSGFSPPHWRKGGDRWDEGYQTTGYFLDWIENVKGNDFVRQLNGAMRDHEYRENLFKELTGEDVSSLWKDYKTSLRQ